MTNLKSIIHEIIVLQATEARTLGFTRLGDAVLHNVGPIPREDEKIIYSEKQLQDTIHKTLWKAALEIVAYHDMSYIDIQDIDDAISDLTGKVISKIEASVGCENKISPIEPKLPGVI